MKQPYEWDENDVLQLIHDQVEESINLEYKASASLQNTDKHKSEISKDVSAFANSVGGTVIYGVAQYADEGRRRLPENIDGGFNPGELSKEWLEQVINSRIQPRIEGVRIHPVLLEQTAPGRVIYAVYIPESFTAHQASGFRYYKRFNFESVPMEDYEVRLVMNNIRYPLLVPHFGFKTMKHTAEAHEYRLTVALENKGMVRAIDIGFHIWWPIEVPQRSRGNGFQDRGEEKIGGRRYLHYVIEFFGSDRVLFPKEQYPLIPPDAGPFHVEYFVDQNTYNVRDLRLHWKLYAADAPPQEGEVPFNQLNEF